MAPTIKCKKNIHEYHRRAIISLLMWNKCTIPDLFLNEGGSVFTSLLELMIWTEHFLPLSCQSTSLCLGDKVRQLSKWLFGGCFDWHVALELQKSASRFPRDTTCLAQGTFVRSIFISLLFSQPISPGHSVRHHLSLTVKLSSVCVCVFVSVCLCECACVFVYVGPPVSLCWLGACRHVSYGCPKDNPQSRLQRNEQRRWMFSEHRRISLKQPVLRLIDLLNHSRWMLT